MEENYTSSQKCMSKKDSYSGLMKELSKFYAAEFLFDTLVVVKDGVVWAHSLMLSAVSPFIKTLLNSVGDYIEDIYVINLPDVEKYELEILLHLLYTGFTLIHRKELENIKSLTGLLKMIKIPVSMVKQNWKSRTKIGHRASSSKRNTSLQSEKSDKDGTISRENTVTNVESPLSDISIKPMLNTSDNIDDYKTKENQPVISQFNAIQNSYTENKTLIPFYDLSASHLPLLHNDISTNNHLSRTSSIINDLATKDFNPLFEENSNFSDFGGGSDADKNNTDNLKMNLLVEKEKDSDAATLQYQHEEIDSIKEIQVFVSDSGEVTALEVLPNDDSTSHKNLHSSHKRYKKSESDNNQIFTSSGQIETFNITNEISSQLISNKEQNNGVATSAGMDINVQQISTFKSDVPYVLSGVEGSEGVMGLISVTEAFENSQKTDFNDVASSTAVVGSETETLIRQCVLCPKSLLGLHAYGRHMKTAHPKLFGPYECPWPNCERTQEDGAKMLTHITQQHSKSGGGIGLAMTDQIQDKKGTTDEKQCLMCNISLSSLEYLTKHNSRFHGITNEKANIISDGDNDGERNVYFCSASDVACKQKFMTSRSYIAHMKQVHKEKPWLCDECGRRFEFKQSYQQHAMLHGPKKSYICDLCSKSYATPRLLYSHRSLHLGRRFPCNMCNFVGRSSANIRGHKINVHGERRLACKVCGKRFAIPSNLQDHMRIHTGETPFTCEICDMSYKRKHHLTCHIRSKAHMSMVINCHKLGIKVPPELDPDESNGSAGIADSRVGADGANIMLPELKDNVMMEGSDGVSEDDSKFETHISEIEADHQVLIFEPCEEIEPYIIQETEEVVVMDVN